MVVVGFTSHDDQSFAKPAAKRWLSAAVASNSSIGRCGRVHFRAGRAIYPMNVLRLDLYNPRLLVDPQVLAWPSQV
jgi:hypothetical protein